MKYKKTIKYLMSIPAILLLLISSIAAIASDIYSDDAKNQKYQPYFEAGGANYFGEKNEWAGVYNIFLPIQQKQNELFYTDLRLFQRYGQHSIEGNAHLGYRFLKDSDHMLGVYGAIDCRKTYNDNKFWQLTFGGESWNNNIFSGFNLYLPISRTCYTVSNKDMEDFVYSKGIANESDPKGKLNPRPMPGFDAEIGLPVTNQITTYIGAYYFKAKDMLSMHGPKIHVNYNNYFNNRIVGIFDKLTVEAGVQNDNIRKTSGFLSLKLSAGFTPKSNYGLSKTEKHMVDLVRRDPDIIISNAKNKSFKESFWNDFSKGLLDYSKLTNLELNAIKNDIVKEKFNLSPKETSIKDVTRKFYALSLINHPDKGGSVENQKNLNINYKLIKDINNELLSRTIDIKSHNIAVINTSKKLSILSGYNNEIAKNAITIDNFISNKKGFDQILQTKYCNVNNAYLINNNIGDIKKDKKNTFKHLNNDFNENKLDLFINKYSSLNISKYNNDKVINFKINSIGGSKEDESEANKDNESKANDNAVSENKPQVSENKNLADLKTTRANICDSNDEWHKYEGQIQSLKGNSKIGLFGTTLSFFTGFAPLAIFGPALKKTKNLTTSTKTILVASPSLGGSVVRLFTGMPTDKDGGRKITLSYLIAGNIGIAGIVALGYGTDIKELTAKKPEYYAWIVCGVLAGIGVGVFPAGTSASAYWYPKNKAGFARGVYAGIGNLAPGMFALILPQLVKGIGLPNTFSTMFGISLVETIAVFAILYNSPFHQLRNSGVPHEVSKEIAIKLGQEQFPNSTDNKYTLKEVFTKSWDVISLFRFKKHSILTISYFVSFGGFMALTQYFPVFFQGYHNAAITTSGYITASYSMGASISRTISGGPIDKFGGRGSSIAGIIGIGVSGIALAFARSITSPLTIIGVSLMSISGGIANAAIFKWICEEQNKNPGGALSKVDGLVGGIGAVGGFVLPQVLGAISGAGTNAQAYSFFTFPALALITILLILFVFDR